MQKCRYVTSPTTLSLTLLTAATMALADDAVIQRCRELSEPTRRLACYDAITVPTKGVLQPRQSPDHFGMERQPLRNEADALESQILGRFDGWSPKARIELANGQIWQISDDSNAVLTLLDPKVVVRRGALGAFYLDIEGTNRLPRVKRVQ